ncbi:grasp-with-spasm system A modified peptide [Chryseobacterium fluminis]|uniref:grasp-with-spasm system A modified peptide n=1 Tax=Chryseobacterium fluminis TaxID=2983606 RepID=UPI0022573380|nr:grasp-with-spasm system A modified peptide [Chryseobacterium sp. MMS21-Ot14]UZT96933.1 grasp-with-spasm system A modified peptide [Chryseobacterium sp. MMS21-Ot14]
MKKLTGMKNFASLENNKLKNMNSVIGGGATNIRTTTPTGPDGSPGNTGDTKMFNDGKFVGTLSID